jgi:WD40 repeat protein
MGSFTNENLFSLVFSTYSLFKMKQLLNRLKNKILNSTIYRSLSYEKIFTLMGHTKTILQDIEIYNNSFALLHNGNIISAINGRNPKMWDTKNDTCIKTLDNSYKGIWKSLSNGNMALILNNQIKILNPIDDFKLVNTINVIGYNNLNTPLLLSDGRLAFTANNGGVSAAAASIIILEHNNEYKFYPSGHSIQIPAMINFTKGKVITSGLRYIKVWDIENGFECFKNIYAHDDLVSSLLYTNSFLISGSHDKTIKIWNEFRCIKEIDAHKARVQCLLLLPNGYFASGSDDKKIKIWDLQNFTSINVLEGHKSRIFNLVLLKDNRIVSNSYDKLIIWNY